MSEAELLRDRLRDLIHNVCNTIGCKNCDLSWGSECSATDLDRRIMEIEMKESVSHSQPGKGE